MSAIITAHNVSRQFLSGKDTIYALKGINMEVEKGKLTILKGRSGSGKTTLMNLFGALDKPTSGDIFFDDINITKLSERQCDKLRRQNIGFVFQSVALISMMSAYENIEFGLRVAGYDARKRKERSEECLKLVGLGKRMHHRPSEMSGGEQQRVAVARAMAHKPQIVFADEPTAELDTHMGLQIVKLFKDLVISEGITVIMTTHDAGMMEVADKIFTLEDGEIVDER
ncbi:ABC transporter ATP-binding protein [Ruminiclostridium herbifermentans]|uniref:ABC transporter ATP-binding protein n=1 Tax=Ruminiclostridium herbifermentans TaxID=2488810 RepID=A0A4U7JJD7_9FIRM|nr:ABC transporter ATP-binding protein [Ruminiclostridium herbifermentans]QNU67384.1 ABC transporter ATP-binding protein [Ruminiclostridium herbifermentans]